MTSVTAERGAAVLDERVPEWADMIDLRTFNLESTCDCVVGQIENAQHPRQRTAMWHRFDEGLAALGLTSGEAHSYGFFGMIGGTVDRTWRKLIRERQTESAEA